MTDLTKLSLDELLGTMGYDLDMLDAELPPVARELRRRFAALTERITELEQERDAALRAEGFAKTAAKAALLRTESVQAERDTLKEALQRAAFIAKYLMQMIDPLTWRDAGGDDQQGHYEGDYRAEQLASEIEQWRVSLLGRGRDRGGERMSGERIDNYAERVNALATEAIALGMQICSRHDLRLSPEQVAQVREALELGDCSWMVPCARVPKRPPCLRCSAIALLDDTKEAR